MSIEKLVRDGIKLATAFYTDYSTIDGIINAYFDLPGYTYEMIVLEEVGNSQYSASWKVTVEPKLPDEYDKKYIEAVRNKNPELYGTRTILNYLSYFQVIPAGRYVIDVSW